MLYGRLSINTVAMSSPSVGPFVTASPYRARASRDRPAGGTRAARIDAPSAGPPTSSPGTSLLADVALEILSKILQRTLEWFGCSWSQRAKRMPRRKKACLEGKLLEIAGLSAPFLYSAERTLAVAQPGPA